MNTSFTHVALSLKKTKPLIYTAMSKHLFYFRWHVSSFVLSKKAVPLNPFMLFDYFLIDTIDRNLVREANNSIILKADEIWVFGPISNGVLAEILLAKENNKPISYFQIKNSKEIIPIQKEEIEMEDEVKEHKLLI